MLVLLELLKQFVIDSHIIPVQYELHTLYNKCLLKRKYQKVPTLAYWKKNHFNCGKQIIPETKLALNNILKIFHEHRKKIKLDMNSLPSFSLFVCDFTDCKRVWSKSSREIRSEILYKHQWRYKYEIYYLYYKMKPFCSSQSIHESSYIPWITWISSMLHLSEPFLENANGKYSLHTPTTRHLWLSLPANNAWQPQTLQTQDSWVKSKSPGHCKKKRFDFFFHSHNISIFRYNKIGLGNFRT